MENGQKCVSWANTNLRNSKVAEKAEIFIFILKQDFTFYIFSLFLVLRQTRLIWRLSSVKIMTFIAAGAGGPN